MAELSIKDKPHFVCIEYPAIVKNEEKLLKSLGGEKTVTEVSDMLHFITYMFCFFSSPVGSLCSALYPWHHSSCVICGHPNCQK